MRRQVYKPTADEREIQRWLQAIFPGVDVGFVGESNQIAPGAGTDFIRIDANGKWTEGIPGNGQHLVKNGQEYRVRMHRWRGRVDLKFYGPNAMRNGEVLIESETRMETLTIYNNPRLTQSHEPRGNLWVRNIVVELQVGLLTTTATPIA